MSLFVANPYWTALTTEQQEFAIGTGLARRFTADVIPFAAVDQPSPESLRELRDLLAPDEAVYVADGATGGVSLPQALRQANCGLVHVGNHRGLQMHHTESVSGTAHVTPEGMPIEPLSCATAGEMVALTDVAFPGFFRRRTCELGTYVGLRERGALVAMAGERLRLPGQIEISAVCTHPAHLRRGYAARLVTHLLQMHHARGVRSMLHVLAANVRAIALYEQLGFTRSGEVLFQLIRRKA